MVEPPPLSKFLDPHLIYFNNYEISHYKVWDDPKEQNTHYILTYIYGIVYMVTIVASLLVRRRVHVYLKENTGVQVLLSYDSIWLLPVNYENP